MISSISKVVTDLSDLKSCDTIFKRSTNLDFLMEKSNHVQSSEILNTLKLACSNSSEKLESKTDSGLTTLASHLFKGILKNSLIDADDASLAGRIIVNKKISIECKKNEKDNAMLYYNEVSDSILNQNLIEYEELKKDKEEELKKTKEIFIGDNEDLGILDSLKKAKQALEFEKELNEFNKKLMYLKALSNARALKKITESEPCYLEFVVDSVQFEFENGGLHNVKPSVRSMVKFKYLRLITQSPSLLNYQSILRKYQIAKKFFAPY